MMIWQPREATFCVIFEILVEGLEDFFFICQKTQFFFWFAIATLQVYKERAKVVFLETWGAKVDGS